MSSFVEYISKKKNKEIKVTNKKKDKQIDKNFCSFALKSAYIFIKNIFI